MSDPTPTKGRTKRNFMHPTPMAEMQPSKKTHKALTPTQYLQQRGRPPVGYQRALCHRNRIAVADGLCQTCYVTNRPPLPVPVTPRLAKELLEEVRLSLREALPEYARLHLDAARISALRGDARPAEWALQTIKAGDEPVVAPVAKDSVGGGVKVMIGVNLGGLPEGAKALPVVTFAAEGEPTT